MYKETKTLFMICETPLHAGSGDSLGIVDMPIQRERHTSFPKIEASSLKGALREFFESKHEGGHRHETIITTFGAEEDIQQAGALGFTDARLLLFPIKSMRGIFAWVTCPRVLKQFAKDMMLTNKDFNIENLSSLSAIDENNCYLLHANSNLTLKNDKIVLEEYTFNTMVQKDLKIGTIPLADWLADNLFTAHSYWKNKAQKDIVILSDNDFQDFVNLSTEVITRTRIDNTTGTVENGALFTEEYLPTESVLYSLVLASGEFISEDDLKTKNRKRKTAEENMSFFAQHIQKDDVFQLGGNATLGKGILRTVLK